MYFKFMSKAFLVYGHYNINFTMDLVEKYEIDGLLKGHWLTTGVSQPVSLGSSI